MNSPSPYFPRESTRRRAFSTKWWIQKVRFFSKTNRGCAEIQHKNSKKGDQGETLFYAHHHRRRAALDLIRPAESRKSVEAVPALPNQRSTQYRGERFEEPALPCPRPYGNLGPQWHRFEQ